jgi:hypothetical protein
MLFIIELVSFSNNVSKDQPTQKIAEMTYAKLNSMTQLSSEKPKVMTDLHESKLYTTPKYS